MAKNKGLQARPWKLQFGLHITTPDNERVEVVMVEDQLGRPVAFIPMAYTVDAQDIAALVKESPDLLQAARDTKIELDNFVDIERIPLPEGLFVMHDILLKLWGVELDRFGLGGSDD